MREILSRFILYRGIAEYSVLPSLAQAFALPGTDGEETVHAREIVGVAVREMMDLASEYEFQGDIWASYLTWYMTMDENPYTLAAEKTGEADRALKGLAKSDFEAFYELMHYDFSRAEKHLGMDVFTILKKGSGDVVMTAGVGSKVSYIVGELATRLKAAPDVKTFTACLNTFYRDYGVGEFGINKAFRLGSGGAEPVFVPVRNMDETLLDDLVGYEIQKKKLIDNTESFVDGREANNCLLFGDSGTGKSTSVRAIGNMYYDRGLRLIELHKHQLGELANVISVLRKRNYKFIIYMDDLSFEENETEYKYLKALMEGGVETRPANILIYATSNRRHLIKETWADRADVSMDDGIHKSDSMEEKLSLANRFGVWISFDKPNQKQYFEIVLDICHKLKIDLDDDEILEQAHRWELSHGGYSGRNARQFAAYLKGRK